MQFFVFCKWIHVFCSPFYCIQVLWKALPFPQGVFLGSSAHFPYIYWYSSIFATFFVFLIAHLFIFKEFLINFTPLNLKITLSSTPFFFESNFFFSLWYCLSPYKIQFCYEKIYFKFQVRWKLPLVLFNTICGNSLCSHT